jgi:ribosomal protein S18 acetylase RimI-like enzyme
VIIKINNKKKEIANQIRDVFQVSYAVEAKLLNAVDFPPLKRTKFQFLNSNTEFYAYYINKDIAGIIELDDNKDSKHIQSLVVHPKYFRKGIGRTLVQFVMDTYTTKIFTVETGIDNYPAIQLYKSFGFEKQHQWNTNHGVIKVRFKKIN